MKHLSRRDAGRLFGLGLGASLVGAPSIANALTRTPSASAAGDFPLDHIVWAVPDLDAGIAQIEELTGVKPAIGGVTPGRSAPHNALFALGNGGYFEVFSPTRATGSKSGGSDGASKWLAAIEDGQSHIVSYAVQVRDRFAKLFDRLPATGLGHTDPRPMGRVKTDGNHLKWELVHLTGSEYGIALPFFIDWLGSKPHPSEDSPAGITLERFEIGHPQADKVRAIYEQLGIKLPVVWSAKPSLVATLRGPKGVIRLES